MFNKHLTTFLFNAILFCRFVHNIDCVKWEDFMESAFWGTNELAELIEPYIMENFPIKDVSENCTNSLIMYADGIKNWKPWAIKMFDSTGKLPSVFLRGTTMDMGSFDECLAIKMNATDESADFKGQFCMLHLKSPLLSPLKRKQKDGKSYFETYGYPPDWVNETLGLSRHDLMQSFGLHLGICIPSTCSSKDLYHIFTSLAQAANLQASLSDCQVLEAKKWSTSSKTAIFLTTGLIGLVVLATITDFQDQDGIKKSMTRNMLLAFSIKSNFQTLFKTNHKESSFDFVYGLKGILMLWILMSHTIIYPTLWKDNRRKSFHNLMKDVPYYLIFLEHGVLATEYLMFLGGFLISTSMRQKSVKIHDKKKKGNFIYVTFLRYLRFIPAQVFLIMLTFALPVIYDGPLWNSTWEDKIKKCQNSGWLNFLYINNFGRFQDICWEHTWFLSGMMQIQICCLGLVFLVKRYPRIGVISGVIIFIGCSAHDFIVSLNNKLLFPSFQVMKSMDDADNYTDNIYIKPYHHFNIFMMGMIVGWLNLRDYKPKKGFIIFGRILCIVLFLAVFFSVKLPTRNLIFTASHHSFLNILLGFQMALLVFLCLTKSAGLLGKFFEWKVFVPLNKLMFNINMFHPVLIVAAEAAAREKMNFSVPSFMKHFLALIIASCLFGEVIYLLIEAPFKRIFDLLEGKNDVNCLKSSHMSNSDEGSGSEDMAHKKDF